MTDNDLLTLFGRISHRLKVVGLSAKAASEKAGLSKDAIRNIERTGTQSPRLGTLKALAPVLGTTVEWLAEGRGPQETDIQQETGSGDDAAFPPTAGPHLWRGEAVPADIRVPNRDDMTRDLPVYGTAAGSLIGSFHFEGGVIDYVRRPPGLVGAKGVYALFVTGDSMDPEHPHGELRFVHPGRPPGPGDTVIVQCKYREDGPIEAYIKRYVRRSNGKLVTRQLNPDSEIVFEGNAIVAVHKVLTMNELFGL